LSDRWRGCRSASPPHGCLLAACALSRQTSYTVVFSPLDYLRRFSQTRGPLKEFSEPTEEPDAHRITYRHRAQRRHRTVGSTERLAARGRVRLLGRLQLVQALQAKLETETGITGAGPPLRRQGRRADGPHNQAKYIQAHLMRRRRTRIRARARAMSPYARDYGAGGAALFDIVNVQIWTRRRASAHRQGRFHTGSGAAIRLSICELA